MFKIFMVYERGVELDNKEYSVKMDGGRNIWLRTDDSKTVLRTDDGKTVVNQITLQESESMPENSTIHNIDLRVVLGRVGLKLNDEEENIYTSGSAINIPAKTKMNLSNQYEEESTIFLMRI